MTDINRLAIYCFDQCGFLAGQAQYIHMGRRFRRRSGIDWTELLLPFAVIAAVAAIAWLVARYLRFRKARQADSPKLLFAELCQAHGLDWGHQQLLRALANAHRLASPAQLFVEPQRFDIESVGTAFENRETQIAELRTKLFAHRAVGAENGQ